jgi:hypothetical protein
VNTLAPGESCTPACNTGYSLKEGSTSSCSAEGVFTAATCVKDITCDVTNPGNGTAGTTNKNAGGCQGVTTLAAGESCTPACNDGYSLKEGSTSSCSAAGVFTAATCVKDITCDVTNPANGTAGTTNKNAGGCQGVTTLAPGESCTPACNTGTR